MPSPRTPLIAIASLAAASLLTASPSGAAEPTPDPATETAVAPVSWQRCASTGLRRSGLKCATVIAPMDPSQPRGDTVRLAVSQLRHTSSDSRYLGVILLNPGGPGGSGLSLPTISKDLPKKVRSRYDWIGFDPRGVGASRPRLTCDPDYFGFDRPNYVPRRRADLDAWLKRSNQYAEDCAANGPLLEHMRTTDSVADMEVIRRALGAEKINYLGFSYGTYLGQIYATQHPTRVDRMILDSNVDPLRAFYKANLDQDVALQKNLDRWFAWIGQRDKTFHLGSSRAAVAKQFDTTSAELDAKPARGKIGSSEWIDIFVPVGYSKSTWFWLGSLFANYVNHGESRELVRAYRSSVGTGDNSFAVYSAVQCVDAPWPTDWATWSRDNWRVYKKAPNMTWMNAWYNAQCRTWPVAPGPRFSVDGRQAPPSLLLGGTYDGATPFAGSLTVRELFPHSVLVEIAKSVNHADSLSNDCARAYISRFLGSGDLPRRKSGDRPDVRCPQFGSEPALG